MKFLFNERKAAQAAAYLLKLAGGRLKYMKLIKLLYLADRESLVTTGHPITGDRYVAMDNGPVLSRIYDLISEEPADLNAPWFEYISEPEDYSVGLRKPEPETDELSRFELGLLENLHREYQDVNQFDLAKLTHTICPEWRNPEGSSRPILPEEILRAAGKSDAEIEQIAHDALELQLIGQLESIVGKP